MYIFYVFNILATNAGFQKISLASSCVVYVTYLTFPLNISMMVACKSFVFANKFFSGLLNVIVASNWVKNYQSICFKI